MKKKNTVTAFYIETLLLVAVFMAVILVITQVFGMGRIESDGAGALTDAVTLAQNAAEAVSVSKSAAEVAAVLDENGSASCTDNTVEARYAPDMTPSRDGEITVVIDWMPDDETDGAFVSCLITVFGDRGSEPVYSMRTGVYVREGTP